MTQERMLRRKWTFQAHGKQVVFIKNRNERTVHVLMKAFLWALYLPSYPDLSVEIRVGDRYKPDVVSLDVEGRPCFWAEAGQVSVKKIQAVAKRYPETHLVIAKWQTPLSRLEQTTNEALVKIKRNAPFDLIIFQEANIDQFIDEQGRIQLSHADVEWMRISA